MITEIKHNFYKTILPWLFCGMGMLFYFYNFFLRVSPSVMHEELMGAFHIGAYQLGNLSAFYYYAYTPMQIPAGILYDRFGTRMVQSTAVLVAVLGLGVFIFANTFWAACLGRFLIGFGGAFAYVGVMKLASNWLAPNRFALAAGITTTFGMSAAIFSDTYLNQLVHQVGYKNSLTIGLIMGIFLSAMILIFMRNKPKNHAVENSVISMREVMKGFKQILVSKQMWLIGLIGCLTYMPSTVFFDLWGIPFLKATYHLSAMQAGNLVSVAFIGWIIGGPLIGAISDKIKRRRAPLIASYIMVVIFFAIIFYIPNLSITTLNISLFLIGAACGSHPLCITLGKENNPLKFSGVSVAFSNCITMLGGVIFQPLVGKLLEIHAGDISSANPIYHGSDFIFALSVVPAGLFLAVILSFFLKETYCQNKESVITQSRSDELVGLILNFDSRGQAM